MKYLKLFDNYSPRIQLQEMGYDIKSHLGNGNDGTVYSLKNGNAIKVFDYDMFVHIGDDVAEDKIVNIEKAISQNFEYLGDIYNYKHIQDNDILLYEMELLDVNPILEFQMDTDYEIDFFGDFHSVLNEKNFDLQKTITSLIDEYSVEERNNEMGFYLPKYVDSVKETLIQYYNDLYRGFEEISKNGFNLDPIDENVVYDSKLKRFKIIDYV